MNISQNYILSNAHRYTFMRNMGMDRIPIAMSKESVETAKKYGLI